ncbi:isoprenylcysteine carboxylmethyltransferase family protein [bacterium]|nr:isoprenylcysteine carboxylmethyltransferase family protein [bacterium]
MPGPLIRTLLALAARPASLGRKIVSLAFGSVLFIVVLPLLFFALGRGLHLERLSDSWPTALYRVPGWLFLAAGVWLLVAVVLTQWRSGGGTPAPCAPTVKLITSGPYALCRNPIQLGAMLYYLGLLTLVQSPALGLLVFIAGAVLGTLYHRGVEEKELAIRFGPAYLEYKKSTPYIFPRLFRRR